MSSTGTLAYAVSRTAGRPGTLVWVDRRGREEAIAAPPRAYLYPRLSPDGTRVALDIRDQENDIWIWDLPRQNLARLTVDPALDWAPVWTPDGRRIVFGSYRGGGAANLYWQAADGAAQPERLTDTPNDQFPNTVSPDGKRLLAREIDRITGRNVVMVSLDGDRQTTPLLHTTFQELNADLSPDGRWVAFQSNESGQDEVYVRPFPDVNSGRWQVSAGGGSAPIWSRNGRELFFMTHRESTRVTAVSVQSGATFSAGKPEMLFEGRYLGGGTGGRAYDVSADGQRFLMIKDPVTDTSTTSASPLVVVVNWFEELKARMAQK